MCLTLSVCMAVKALSRHPTAGPKQMSQEQLSPDKESVTYNQITLVKALMQQKIAWNELIVNPPGPPRGVQSSSGSPPMGIPQQSSAGAPPMGIPQQGSAGAPLGQEDDDDVIPF